MKKVINTSNAPAPIGPYSQAVVAGGLLFGTLSGGLLAIVGSTAGAIGLFLAVRYHLAEAIAARRGRFLDAIRTSLHRDGFSYLLAIRLIPAFPFSLVNLAAALSGMRLLPYGAATVIGWGLVTNTFADWLKWQGYLLEPLGLGGKTGDWAYANLGVLVALGLGFVAQLVVSMKTVPGQEQRA